MVYGKFLLFISLISFISFYSLLCSFFSSFISLLSSPLCPFFTPSVGPFVTSYKDIPSFLTTTVLLPYTLFWRGKLLVTLLHTFCVISVQWRNFVITRLYHFGFFCLCLSFFSTTDWISFISFFQHIFRCYVYLFLI